MGRDINVIEQKYKTFKEYVTREDGSGYAVLMTEQITGKKMYDSGDYSCYYMEFDKNGKIIKVYCARPFGGWINDAVKNCLEPKEKCCKKLLQNEINVL